MRTALVILAAGQGTRMKSRMPKVLHPLAGQPLLAHVLDTARRLAPERLIVVIGHEAEKVRDAFADALDITWVLQREQLGTGHALLQALPHCRDYNRILVMYGDVPLIHDSTLRALLESKGELALLAAQVDRPDGYGRVVRDQQGQFLEIVEHRDANPEQRRINEINTGFLAINRVLLDACLDQLRPENAQGEYYLTDVPAIARRLGASVAVQRCADLMEVQGVNSREQLAELERFVQRREASRLMAAGVTLADPDRLLVRGTLTVGCDIEIDPDVLFEGDCVLEDDVRIGQGCVLRNVHLARGVTVHPYSHLTDCRIGTESLIGPFARIRPGSELQQQTHIGNFVEIKNANIAQGSKINHLSYIGDTDMGSHVNIGAGTITCNYDGANKHRTRIGNGAFIGSDCQLIAPVVIGAGATIGAGSTIRRDAPADELTLSRSRQITVAGWKRPVKKG